MSRPHLLLAGCGHAHLFALEALATRRLQGVRTTLISPSAEYYYSGMMPGVIAGCYRPEMARFRAGRLAAAAGAEWTCARVTRVDARLRQATLDNGQVLRYDLLSLDIGAGITGDDVPGVREYAVWAKPMQRALQLVPRAEGAVRAASGRPARIVVVGAGAAGIEVSLCLDAHLRSRFGRGRYRITVVEADESILGGYPDRFRKRAARLLRDRGIDCRTGVHVETVKPEAVVSADGAEFPCDVVFWATGPRAPQLAHASGLPHDRAGYLLVRSTLQSVADPAIFAAGDCATLAAAPWIARAGVYAVRQGPVLVRNLARYLQGRSLARFAPQRDWLSLMNTGDGRALGSYKGLAFQGAAVWWLKDRIDRRFMRRFQRLETPE